MNAPWWVWLLVGGLCLLGILALLGVQFDLDANDSLIVWR